MIPFLADRTSTMAGWPKATCYDGIENTTRA